MILIWVIHGSMLQSLLSNILTNTVFDINIQFALNLRAAL